jgi:hypothetical protein
MVSESERLEIEDVPIGTWCWLIHHETIVEKSTEPMSNRVEFIKECKPKGEIETRLKWMRPIRGELPAEVMEAWKAYEEARKAHKEARKVDGEAWKVYEEASKVHGEAIENNQEAIEKLHREECPGCPWSWDQGTLFPK